MWPWSKIDQLNKIIQDRNETIDRLFKLLDESEKDCDKWYKKYQAEKNRS